MTEWLDGKPGLTVLTETEGKQLVVRDGVVVGVIAQKADGTVIQANGKGVVVATGGFSQDKELMTELSGIDWSTSGGFVTPATGDGYRMMKEVGAANGTVCFINTMCVQTPAGTQDMVPINIGTNYQCLPMVNQFGERFMAEDTFAKYFAMLTLNAMTPSRRPGRSTTPTASSAWSTTTSTTASWPTSPVTASRASPTSSRSSPVATTSRRPTPSRGWPSRSAPIPQTLRETVDRWNGFCAAGVDEDFGVSPLHPLPHQRRGALLRRASRPLCERQHRRHQGRPQKPRARRRRRTHPGPLQRGR